MLFGGFQGLGLGLRLAFPPNTVIMPVLVLFGRAVSPNPDSNPETPQIALKPA